MIAATSCNRLTFVGKTCEDEGGEGEGCTPTRFSNAKDLDTQLFLLTGADAGIDACQAKCTEDIECKGVYLFYSSSNKQKCRGK